MSGTVNAGAVVHIQKLLTGEDKPDSYKIDQLNLEPKLPPSYESDDNPDLVRRNLDWSFGPLKVSVELDIVRGEFGITASVLGISLGTFYGSLEKGIEISVNLLLVKGSLRFYARDNALWVRIDLDVSFDGSYHEDKKIIGF